MRLALAALLLLGATAVQAQPSPEPIIDMHLHADTADGYGPPPMGMCTPLAEMPAWDPRADYPAVFLSMFKQPACSDPVWSPTTDAELMERTIAVMERLNVFGVLSGTPDMVRKWQAAAPGRFWSGLNFRLERGYTLADVEALRASGRLDVLAEVTNQYEGMEPGDERLEPFWAFAEAHDIPVGIHVGPGPPGTIYLGAPGNRVRLSSALLLEPVLVRHPRLRLYVMHAGYPLIDDMIALMYAYPQVYVDTGAIVYIERREAFYPYLKRLVDAGFGKRILFGSDQMVWPETIERSVRVIEEAPFLTAAQKRDILYYNAARFLRLSVHEEQPRPDR
jgi:hypothetical protein